MTKVTEIHIYTRKSFGIKYAPSCLEKFRVSLGSKLSKGLNHACKRSQIKSTPIDAQTKLVELNNR